LIIVVVAKECNTNTRITLLNAQANTVTVAISLSAILLVTPTIAMAQNPHFVQASARPSGGHTVVVGFKIAGLDDNQLITVMIDAQSDAANGQCVTRGSGEPEPKTVTGLDITPVSGTFSSGKNGQITGSLTLRPPTISGEDAGCSNPNWSFQIDSITYSGVTISGTGAGTQSLGDVTS
jgi:hypothetical protein